MKTFKTPVIILFLLLYIRLNANWQVNPGEHKCFIENKGQFYTKTISSEEIKYGVSNMGYKLYFTKHGFILYCEEINRLFKRDIENETDVEVKNTRNRIKSYMAEFMWKTPSQNVDIIAELPLTNKYHYAHADTLKSSYNCIAYQKITYKNLYNNIDVEFEFPEKGGIKYAYIVRPGGNVSDIKMEYISEQLPELRGGNIYLSSDFGDIIENAPITFYDNSSEIIKSKFKLEENIVSFEIEKYDNLKTIIIDPWIIFPIMPSNNKSFEIQKDLTGNVYVLGGHNPFTLNKYTSAGVLLWTLSLPLNATDWCGDLLVHDNNHTYVSDGTGISGMLAKINNFTGVAVWSSNASAGGIAHEHFRLIQNCDKSKIYSGSGGVARLLEINQSSGALTPNPIAANGEVKSICRAPNGNFYLLINGSNRLIALSGSLSPLWNISNGHALPYHVPLYLANGGINAIAANNKFIYTYDGTLLIKRDICNGSFINSTNVPSGIYLMNGGIMLDSCGSVYVGSQNGVYKYDPNLTLITSSTTPNAVYDISMGIFSGEILVCGNGFASAINMSVCQTIPFSASCPPLLTVVTNTAASCGSSCSGSATVTPIGTGPFEYLWLPGGETTPSINNLCAGVYSVYVADRYTKLCSPVTVTITFGSIPNLSSVNTATIFCSPSTATLSASSTAGGSLNYNWSGPGIISGASTSSPVVNQSGTYTVTLTQNGACTNTAIVNVISNTTIPNLGILVPDTLTCTKSSIVLTATSSVGGLNYQWLSGPGSSTYTVFAAGDYTVHVTNPVNGCINSATVSVIQNGTFPDLSVSVSNTLSCSNTSAILTSTSTVSSLNYQWIGGPSTPNHTVSVVGIYTVMAINVSTGCSSTATISVESAPLFTINLDVVLHNKCFNDSTGVLQINYVSGGVFPFNVFNFNNSGNISGITSFPVIISNLAAGNYSIEVSDGAGCKQILFADINQPAPLVINAAGNSTICEGESAVINASVSGGSEPYSYQWLPISSTVSSLSVSPAATQEYTLTVTDKHGCNTSASKVVQVHPTPKATLLNSKFTGCAPSCITFNLSEKEQPSYQYQWTFTNNQGVLSPTTSVFYKPEICFLQSGSYNASLTILSAEGCSVSSVYNYAVQLHEKPLADFDFNPENPNILEPVINFTNHSKGADTYVWYNSAFDAPFSIQEHPSYIFKEAGKHLIVLIAKKGSCADTLYKRVEVEDEFLFYAPNAFTPNGDNLNDTWRPVISGYKEGSFQLLVFNRWGNKLFESNDPLLQGWNGMFKGELCKDDVYVWKVNVQDKKGKNRAFSGKIVLYK